MTIATNFSNSIFLTDGGIETSLIFQDGFDLRGNNKVNLSVVIHGASFALPKGVNC
jgi:hypothetical protein